MRLMDNSEMDGASDFLTDPDDADLMYRFVKSRGSGSWCPSNLCVSTAFKILACCSRVGESGNLAGAEDAGDTWIKLCCLLW